jgi:hypothetical protein
MASHEIEVELPARQIVNTDLVVTVRSDGVQLGELRISRGTLDWRPGKHQRVISLGWETFARLIQDWDAAR